ncbi:MAG TPA: hypothetical protein VMI32_22035 [Candidatus Solibacter sp.]|nr:hypothetical protein [Candidatus Solibacter sp.]
MRDQKRAVTSKSRKGEKMPAESPGQKSAGMWMMILSDVHFWIPAVILAAGLAVLDWIR